MLEAIDLGLQQPARLQHITACFRSGALTVILGPNGAGKSTLLHTLAGSHPPESGSLLLNGIPIASLSSRHLADHRAVVEQHPLRPRGMRVSELISIGAQSHSTTARLQAITLTGLQPLLTQDCANLSGGELARAHLARALYQLLSSTQPIRYLLLDEPTAALDIGAANLMLGQLRDIAHRCQLGIVTVLHDLNLALAHADDVLTMKNGSATGFGTAANMLTKPHLEQLYDTTLTELHTPDGLRAFIASPVSHP